MLLVVCGQFAEWGHARVGTRWSTWGELGGITHVSLHASLSKRHQRGGSTSSALAHDV